MKNPQAEASPKVVHLKDYKKPDFLIPEIALDFDLNEASTLVTSTLHIRRQSEASPEAALILNGEKLKLVSLELEGKHLIPSDYELSETHLTLAKVPDEFTLKVVTEIKPQDNKALEGLYKSRGIFCTQNESEGFRKITYFLDRPDIMSRFTTRIAADKELYPVLLSNGNTIAKGSLPGGRHFVTWQNPFAMPCYLFALVAGQLVKVEEPFTTKSGRKVSLQIFVEKGNESKCGHAMESLKKAMRWDEQIFGLEYDLDIYMIVAVDDFNFGAMENKGLNIFNSQYILADPKSATDQNYEAIQMVVAHEYFHNWTGNRVTCRDWFQITLKEGLTVFREQEFTADMTSRAVKRIEEARKLRDFQFPEDAGPNAHPIRPPSYIEINNFYTVTIYEKGADVIRMIQTLIGRPNFVKGIHKYFELFDGQAVTTEDFLLAMEQASGMDLTQFKYWYNQAGTPTVVVRSHYDVHAKVLELHVEQKPGGGPPPEKHPFFFPFKIGLLDQTGQEIPMPHQGTLIISQPKETFRFENIPSKPVLSLLRHFSAPVRLESDQTEEDYLFLLKHDTDAFNRFEAGQRLALQNMKQMLHEIQNHKMPKPDSKVLEGFSNIFKDKTLDHAFISEILTMPSLTALLAEMPVYDFDAAFQAREEFLKALALTYEKEWAQFYQELKVPAPYQVDQASIGKRLLKNKALSYLLLTQKANYGDLALQQFEKADNMTDEISSLAMLCQTQSSAKESAVQQFYKKWHHDILVMNKWFAVQADSKQPDTLVRVKDLEKSPAYDGKNPNKIRSLIGVFGQNLVRFHDKTGAGYDYLTQKILEIDTFNPSAAAKLSAVFKYFPKLDSHRKNLMRTQLEKILAAPKLSANTYEIISKTLASGHSPASRT